MRWHEANWPDFVANKLHITCGYEAKSKVLDPKTDPSVRDVDMAPSVRRVLESLPSRKDGGLVFPRVDAACSAEARWRKRGTAPSSRPRSGDCGPMIFGTPSRLC